MIATRPSAPRLLIRTSTSYLIGSFDGSRTDLALARQAAAKRFPEITLLAAGDFQASSSRYSLSKTGTGLAILLAALLARLPREAFVAFDGATPPRWSGCA